MNCTIQLDRQRAAIEAIGHRCKALHLRRWAARRAVSAVRGAIRDGKSVAFAVAAGVAIAKDLARRPGGCIGAEVLH